MCELKKTIGNTGIEYCSIPSCDCNSMCPSICKSIGKDAITALAEIVSIYGELIDRLEKKVFALEHSGRGE